MQLFYSPAVSVPEHQLNEVESRHITKVMRKHVNDSLWLTDGGGNLYTAVIIRSHEKRCVVRTELHKTVPAPKPHLTIAIAMPKRSERFEWFLEKSTELGVNRIIPIICQRSERTKPRTDRWQKVIVAAMKQSTRLHLPQLDNAIKFDQLLEMEWLDDTSRFIAHCMDGYRENVWDVLIRGQNAVIAIGPEGDFSTQEVEKAVLKDWRPINLDEYRLRTETAAMTCVHGFRWLHKSLGIT